MDPILLPPLAGPFIESLRSIGYSLPSAVADVVDNAISAKATQIDVVTDWCAGKPYMAIFDNGEGMAKSGVRKSMQLGAIGPSDEREATDLGRFGMGLKTASFSQCQELTLISRAITSKEWYGVRWDLKKVEQQNEWLADVISPEECENELNKMGFLHDIGSLVLWREFDGAKDVTAINQEKDYDRSIGSLVDHLSLTFHRYLSGNGVPKKISLKLNGSYISPMDPFALHPEQGKPGSTILSEEKIRLGDNVIQIRAYQIPHPMQMSHDFAGRVSLSGNHHAAQGIYIYRSGRLISSGGWFKLAKASEANKLARIQVEFENSTDELWKIDVKKSRVELPSSLREQLRRIVKQCSSKSSSTFKKRAKMPTFDSDPVWDRVYDRERERVSYSINKKNALLSKILKSIADSSTRSSLITLLEQGLPLELIKNDISASAISIGLSPEEKLENCQQMIEEFLGAGIDKDIIATSLSGDSNIGLDTGVIFEFIENMDKGNYGI